MDGSVVAKGAALEGAEVARTEALLVRGGGRPCALALSCVIETMRPLPVAPEPAAPRLPLRTAFIRGTPTLVLDLGALLAPGTAAAPGRYVTLRLASADRLALSVDEVLAVHRFEVDKLLAHPGVLTLVDRQTIAELRRFDPRLVKLLETSLRILSVDPRAPDEAKAVFA